MSAATPTEPWSPIELRRAELALEAARLRLELLELTCAEPSPDPITEQRLEALHRRWLQLDCHRQGKDLAIAEARRDAGDVGPAIAATIAFYAPRIEQCIDRGVGSAEVRFPSSDGGVVHASLHGVGERAVVLAHGGRFTKESWSDQIPAFVDAGLRVMAIDFRGRGRSRGPDGDKDGEYDDVHHDVLGAVRYLRSTGSTEVAVVGASFGGAAAARAAVEAGPGEIDLLVLLAPSVIERPEGMQGRKLVLVAEGDVRGGGVRRLDEIRPMLERTPGPKELVVLPGEAHAQFLFETEQAGELLRRIVEFVTSE